MELTTANDPKPGDQVYSSSDVTFPTQPKAKRLVLKDPTDPEFKNEKKKTPRRTLHFSDGILEEYSETEDEDEVDNTPALDPKTLKWGEWLWHYSTKSGSEALRIADYLGEKLAWFFGITSPKYQAAIDEYNRIQKQEEEEKEAEVREKEFQRQRQLQGSGIDVEGGVSTYHNQAFGLELTDTSLKEQQACRPPEVVEKY